MAAPPRSWNEVTLPFGPHGIIRDRSRWTIPAGGAYTLQDFIVDLDGEIYKRGGSGFQSSELEEALIVAVACPEFPGDPRVVALASDGGSTRTIYDVTGGSATDPSDANGAQPAENMPLFVDKLILCDGLGESPGVFYTPQKIYLNSGTLSIADLGGSPPIARRSCVHLSYLVLANSFDNPNRLWFSPVTDIEDDWDTGVGGAYIDVPNEITGLASINGVLIVFTRGESWRIIGDVPPGTDITDDNMILQPLAAVGCVDARSIVKMDGNVYWAHESGVYFTNGAAVESITTRQDSNGITSLWADAVAGFSPVLGSVVCAGQWLDNFLFLTVRHADDDPQSGARYQFLYSKMNRAWSTLSDGVTADMYATRNAPNGEIYAACGDLDDPVRLLTLSGLFNPTASNMNDANGEAVEPYVELNEAASGPTLKAYGFGHLTYDLRNGSGTAWNDATSYTAGDRVTGGDRTWEAVIDGTSDSTEPDWDTATAAEFNSSGVQDSYALKNIAADTNYVFQADVYIPTATLTAILAGSQTESALVLSIASGGFNTGILAHYDGANWKWSSNGGETDFADLTPDTWTTLQIAADHVSGTTWHLIYGAGIDFSGTDTVNLNNDTTAVMPMYVGALDSLAQHSGELYFVRNVIVTDSIDTSFQDSFASGFGNWDSSTGTVTAPVVYDNTEFWRDVTATLSIYTAQGYDASSFVLQLTADATTEITRVRFPAYGDSQAMTVKIAQNGASSSTRLFTAEIDVRGYDTDADFSGA